MPSPQGPVPPPNCKGARSFRRRKRRTGVRERLWPATALGARASCPRYARQSHWFEGGLGHARLSARGRARCPPPQGPSPSQRRQELAPQKTAHRGLRAAMASDGPWGRGHLALAMRRSRIGSRMDWVMRACRRVGGQDALPPRARHHCKGARSLRRRKRRTGICERLWPATGPGGEGILPSLCAAGALVRRWIGSCACRRVGGQDSLPQRSWEGRHAAFPFCLTPVRRTCLRSGRGRLRRRHLRRGPRK